MKVGVDGVLVGAWADVAGVASILDAGTGCGVISLMMAQRAPQAEVLAIDADHASVMEAQSNFEASPWRDRLEAQLVSFEQLADSCHHDFDLIVSNPPYFSSGIITPDSRRLSARHQGKLSPLALLSGGKKLLKEKGRVVMIIPADQTDSLVEDAMRLNFGLRRITLVRGHSSAPLKRALLDFAYRPTSDMELVAPKDADLLTLEESPGIPTHDYIALCRDFYLKF